MFFCSFFKILIRWNRYTTSTSFAGWFVDIHIIVTGMGNTRSFVDNYEASKECLTKLFGAVEIRRDRQRLEILSKPEHGRQHHHSCGKFAAIHQVSSKLTIVRLNDDRKCATKFTIFFLVQGGIDSIVVSWNRIVFRTKFGNNNRWRGSTAISTRYCASRGCRSYQSIDIMGTGPIEKRPNPILCAAN